MDILNGIKNFLGFINDNWTTIIVIIGLGIAIYKKAKDYLSKSDEEKIAIAKTQIEQTVLKMITEAEVYYEDWNKAGEIKRSQVISEIFTEYPILNKVMNQEELIAWMDEVIDDALDTLRKIIEENRIKES